MDSCLLFHGPGARQHALDDANRRGRLIHEPFGDAGLKVDEAREFVALLQVAPSCRELGIVIAGPMDKARPKSADVLLKAIEQFSDMVLPILWATDIGGVRNTIRSRCLPFWAPATGFEPVDEEVEATARELLHAALGGRVAEIPTLVARVKANAKKKIPGRERELLAEVSDAMSAMADDPRVRVLWERVRKVAHWQNPTQLEIIAAFLPGSH
jgi:hypothetical protein